MKNSPSPDAVFPNEYGTSCFIKNVIAAPNISVGDYTYYDDLSEVEAWLAENDTRIQCVTTDMLQHPRRCPVGRTQYPTLTDYADGVDVMEFLTQR